MASEGSANPFGMKGPFYMFRADYYKCKDLPGGVCITSPTFAAGGYDWALDFYPNGDTPEEHRSRFSIFLRLESEVVADIAAKHTFYVLLKTGAFVEIGSSQVDYFTSGTKSRGLAKFPRRYLIEEYWCVDGIFSISCTIETTDVRSNNIVGGLCEHIGKLWDKMERADVIFEVGGENFSAHRLILAARSPVFEANLYGQMAEAKIARIKIEEMKPEVFKALLHFIYTDQLAKDDSSDHQAHLVELLHDLFVAADRYALDNLCLLCEEHLVKNLSVDTVAATLLVADRHSLFELKASILAMPSSRHRTRQPRSVDQRNDCAEILTYEEMKAEVFMALLHFIYTDQLAKDGSVIIKLFQLKFFRDS